MTVKTPDTVDIVRDLVTALTPIFLIDAATLLTTTTYRLDTFDTFWLRPEKVITIDSKQYRITAFVINESITIEDVTSGAGIPTVMSFAIPAPNFFHGTPVMMNNEHTRKKAAPDKTPFIWLQEVLEETQIDDRRSAFGRTSSPRIFFMDESKLADWTSEQHKTNAIEPARQIAELFFANIRADRSMFGEIKNYKSTNRANWGKFLADHGNIKLLINQNVSGVETFFDFQMTKKACDTRISGIVCTIGVVMAKTDPTSPGASDGTATANEFGDQSTVTYQWFDEFMVPIGQTTKTATGLTEGTFFVEVTDAITANCVATGEIELEDPPAAFIPSDILGMKVWLAADDQTSFNAGSINDLDKVTDWKRQVGSEVDFNQTTGVNQPVWNSDGFGTNNKPYVNFNGSQWLNSIFDLVLQPYSVIIVLEKNTNIGSDTIMANGTGVNFQLFTSSGDTLGLFNGTATLSDGSLGTVPVITKSVSNGVLSKIGKNLDAFTTGNTGTGGILDLRIGANEGASPTAPGDERIAEIVLYNNEISSADFTTLINFFKTKYGI